ncbi:hypothetical protein G5I_13626 [Acromyrmex echinatior]|uniref:Uncharacterized protein n=1 Tax=Acromyrmex echinatior TaxID=103372 RepID=F4X5J2_ACREC|nr:hypothetical protein G5I_13626 [Acromyrmex echinatior]
MEGVRAYFAWRTRSTSWRTHEEHERERARTSDRSATRTTATVSHEREQGDERHELRTVAAYGRMPDGGERENSTWFARAEGRRDETRVQLGTSEMAMARSGE